MNLWLIVFSSLLHLLLCLHFHHLNHLSQSVIFLFLLFLLFPLYLPLLPRHQIESELELYLPFSPSSSPSSAC